MSEPRLARTAAGAGNPLARLEAYREQRAERVARLARAVDEGTYRPDAAAIADAILRHLERRDEPPPLC